MAVCLSGKMPFTLVIPGKFLGAVGHRKRGTRDSPFCRRLGRDEKCRNGMEWLLGAFIHYIRRTLAFQLLLGGNGALGYQLLLINHKNWNKSLPGLAWRLVQSAEPVRQGLIQLCLSLPLFTRILYRA